MIFLVSRERSVSEKRGGIRRRKAAFLPGDLFTKWNQPCLRNVFRDAATVFLLVIRAPFLMASYPGADRPAMSETLKRKTNVRNAAPGRLSRKMHFGTENRSPDNFIPHFLIDD